MFRIDLSSLSCGNLIHTRNGVGVQCLTMYRSCIFFFIACTSQMPQTFFFSRKVATSFLSHLKEAKKRSFLFSHFFSEPDFFYFVWSSNNMEKRIVIECCDYDTATQFHLLFRFTLPQELFEDPQRFLRQCDQH